MNNDSSNTPTYYLPEVVVTATRDWTPLYIFAGILILLITVN